MSKPVIKALVIDPDAPAGSAVREIDQELSTFQQLVGGYIEGVYGLDDDGDAQATIFINEEGKIYGLPVNRIATLIWYHLEPEVRGHDVLCGTAVIVGGKSPLRLPASIRRSHRPSPPRATACWPTWRTV